MTFTVTLSDPAGRDVTVDFATADASATAPDDYTAASGTLTFHTSPGVTTYQAITVPIQDDEPDETLTVVASSVSQKSKRVLKPDRPVRSTAVWKAGNARPGRPACAGRRPQASGRCSSVRRRGDRAQGKTLALTAHPQGGCGDWMGDSCSARANGARFLSRPRPLGRRRVEGGDQLSAADVPLRLRPHSQG